VLWKISENNSKSIYIRESMNRHDSQTVQLEEEIINFKNKSREDIIMDEYG
jgi:hypothetical protein